MSPSQSRRHRGLRSQKVVADYFTENGFPFAESTGAGRSGVDVTGLVGISLEVKARAAFQPMAWVRQAQTSHGLPLVCFRPNGLGESTIASWPCIIRLEDLVVLLRTAGYGEPLAGDLSASHTREVLPDVEAATEEAPPL